MMKSLFYLLHKMKDKERTVSCLYLPPYAEISVSSCRQR